MPAVPARLASLPKVRSFESTMSYLNGVVPDPRKGGLFSGFHPQALTDPARYHAYMAETMVDDARAVAFDYFSQLKLPLPEETTFTRLAQGEHGIRVNLPVTSDGHWRLRCYREALVEEDNSEGPVAKQALFRSQTGGVLRLEKHGQHGIVIESGWSSMDAEAIQTVYFPLIQGSQSKFRTIDYYTRFTGPAIEGLQRAMRMPNRSLASLETSVRSAIKNWACYNRSELIRDSRSVVKRDQSPDGEDELLVDLRWHGDGSVSLKPALYDLLWATALQYILL